LDKTGIATSGTEKQMNLAKALQTEAEAMGLAEISLGEHAYLMAILPANTGDKFPTIWFIAYFHRTAEVQTESRATRKLHELWLRFLTEINERTRETPPELLSEEYISEAMHYMEVGAYNKKQLLACDEAKMAEMTARSMLSDSEEKRLP
jgi:hypothetical protein